AQAVAIVRPEPHHVDEQLLALERLPRREVDRVDHRAVLARPLERGTPSVLAVLLRLVDLHPVQAVLRPSVAILGGVAAGIVLPDVGGGEPRGERALAGLERAEPRGDPLLAHLPLARERPSQRAHPPPDL